ncbi:MAG TPA: lysine biosynthesis protein LysW [Phycisphaerales bacterium]|nr:lysine biosynthesis protein LysW [Phycisphaerales bacterium]
MTSVTTTTTVSCECPECGAPVTLRRRPLNGEVVPCPDCGVDLEVTSTEPLRVEVAPPVQEDWGE